MTSPIEQMLHSAIVDPTGTTAGIYDRCTSEKFCFEFATQEQVNIGQASVVGQVLVFADPNSAPPAPAPQDVEWHLYQQARLLGYKLDFLVVGRLAAFAVECDGFEFHEKTPQQATYDKSRDRELAIAGVCTLRFTGSEIYRDADRCASHVHAFARHLARSQDPNEIARRWMMLGRRGADYRLVDRDDCNWTDDCSWTAGMLAGVV
jgi:very-short-patch-repair endonuclease